MAAPSIYLSTLDIEFGLDLFKAWERITDHGKDLDAVRILAMHDRYFLLVQMCGRKDMLHPWVYDRCRQVERDPDGYIDLWGREHFKDLADDTPMLTDNRGWVTHGELVVGDDVFSPDGSPTQVIALSDRYTDSECYEVTFEAGESVVCGAGHLWCIREKHRTRIAQGSDKRSISYRNIVVPTHTIAQMIQNGERIDVGVTQPIQYEQCDLPIDPYTFGVWLGDGTSSSATLTNAYSDIEIIERIMDNGVEVKEVSSSNINTGSYRLNCGVRGKKGTGMMGVLTQMGVRNNKHIPLEYMTSSVEQRMELLRGLMDTDGHCNTRGTATFTNINTRLAQDVYDLAVGLGLRPNIRKHGAKLDVKRSVDGIYWFWQVSFQAHTDRRPFHLSRKVERCISPSHYRGIRTIRSVRLVPSVPTRCIQVDREDGMYCAGRELIPTHNSSIITFGGSVQRILQNPEITIGIFSHVNSIASDFLRQIKVELETNENLKKLFPHILWDNPSQQAQRWSVDGGLVVKRKGNPKEATVEASGLVDGQPIGKHYQLRIYDDVVTDKSVATPEQINKTTNSYSLSQSLGVIGGEEWTVGTRYSYADTYEWILKRGALKPRVFPATDDGTRDGKPVYFSQEEWNKRLVKNTDSDIACQYLQNPLSGQQRIFNVEDLQVYEIRPQTLAVYVLCDPARSKKKDSANTAIIVIGLDYAGNKYVLDGFNHKMDLQERWENFAKMYLKWTNATGVQNVRMGYEAFGAQSDLDYFKEQMRLPDRPRFDVVELMWPRDGEGSKTDRVQRLVPDCRGHKIFLPYNTDNKNLTSHQRMMKEQGYEYRIARPIRRKDEHGNLYDLSEQLKMQFHYFPFGLKDAIDATARIYDMEPKAPNAQEPSYAEPEYV